MESVFVLAKYFWAWSLPWNVIDIPSDTLLGNTDFLFSSRYGFELWVRVGFLCLFPILHVGMLSGLILCRSCAAVTVAMSLNEYWYLESSEKGFDKDILFRAECQSLSVSAHCLIVGLFVHCHLLQEETLRSELRNALIYGHSNMSL